MIFFLVAMLCVATLYSVPTQCFAKYWDKDYKNA